LPEAPVGRQCVLPDRYHTFNTTSAPKPASVTAQR
jgi:hypothetical protein